MATVADDRSRAFRRAGLLALGLVGTAGAQTAPDLPAPGIGAGAYSVMSPSPPATTPGTATPAAQASSALHTREGWRLTPTIEFRETATDNVAQAPSIRAQSDWVTEIIPGIRIDGSGRRVKLHLDYRMDNLIYARDSSRNNIQNDLNAFGSLEAVENFLFVEARASISQDSISAFGPRLADPTAVNPNRTETRAYQVSPYLRGRLVGDADYLIRYDYSDLHSTSDPAGDSRVGDLTARVAGKTSLSKLAWSAELFTQSVDNEKTRDTEDNRARGTLTYSIDPQIHLTGTAGYERTDLLTIGMSGEATYGAGFQWAPTPRTLVYGNWEHRFYGDGWSYGATHHTPFMAFALSDSRDVTTDAEARLGSVGYTTAYNLLYAALSTRFPDPIDRAAETQRLLQSGNIPTDLGLPSDFVVGSAYLERRQTASASFLGIRNTVTFSLYKSSRDILGLGESTPTGVAQNTREWGGGVVYSHRLTPFTTWTAGSSWIRASSASGASTTTTQWNASTGVATQLSLHTSCSLTYRYTRFNGTGGSDTDYRENALTAALLLQF